MNVCNMNVSNMNCQNNPGCSGSTNNTGRINNRNCTTNYNPASCNSTNCNSTNCNSANYNSINYNSTKYTPTSCNTANKPSCQSSCQDVSSTPPEQGCSCRNAASDKYILMKNIYELGFILTETNLYLDTHPNDSEAIEYYAQIKDKYRACISKYADYYGPLDKLHLSNDNYWMWVATPMPWEMEDC